MDAFMDYIPYTGYAVDLETDTSLPAEGILTGRFGSLRYERCSDGIAIIQSDWKSFGFLTWPGGKDIGLPNTINHIPVTELRQTFDSPCKITIDEGVNLKRLFLQFKKTLPVIRPGFSGGPANYFVGINLCYKHAPLDACSIICPCGCILDNAPVQKHLRIEAPVVLLYGPVEKTIETADFSGDVYPYETDDWDGILYYNRFFSGCGNLRFAKGSFKGTEGWIFSNCSKLTQIHLSEGIRKIPPHAFERCSSLKDLYIPDSVTELGEYAFAECVNLQSIHLPDGIRKIPKGLFKNCRSLLKCYLSDKIEVIESEAFSGCTSLRKPWIPKSIIRIDDDAF